MHSSRFPEFYKLSVEDRVRKVREKGLLSKSDYLALSSGEHTLSVQHADKMIENVIGVMGLPVGLGLNFLINKRDGVIRRLVPEVTGCGAADVDLSGSLDFADVSGFLAAFATQGPSADLTGEGSYDFADVSAFLSLFAAGCP